MLANRGEFTLDMIGELLTHKSYEMTKRYAKFLPGSLKKAGDRAAELIQQNVLEGAKMKKKIKPADQTEELNRSKGEFIRRNEDLFKKGESF